MYPKLFKPFVFILVLVLFVSLACSVDIKTDSEPTETEEEQEIEPSDTPRPSPTPRPTATQGEAEEPTPVSGGGRVNRNASNPGEIIYEEDFTDPDSWVHFLLRGKEENFTHSFGDGMLRTNITKQNTWVYYTFQGYEWNDIRIDIKVENQGSNTNYVGMLCRYSNDGWYEVNILNTGEYFIYFYDGFSKKLNILFSGGSRLIKTGKSTNEYTMICKGETLTLGINGTEVRTVELKTGEYRFLETGQVGLSVSADQIIPVIVDVIEFTLSVPH